MARGIKAAGVAWLVTAVYDYAWILRSAAGGAAAVQLEQYQTAFEPLVYGVGLAIVLKETGPAARPPAPVAARGNP